MSSNHRTPPYFIYMVIFVAGVAILTLAPVAAVWHELAELMKPLMQDTPTNQ